MDIHLNENFYVCGGGKGDDSTIASKTSKMALNFLL